MRWPRALALLVFLALLPSCIGRARADPAIVSMGPGEGAAVWTFSNPANYTLDNVALDLGARLARSSGGFRDTTRRDFQDAVWTSNIDLDGHPGDVEILNTSQLGPVQTTTFQPDSAAGADNYLYAGC